ncbi:hypothetical protein AT15_05570 [Kosmotoga arenicorallina S304]|uniref:Mannose-6-phosphate isomerase n=1 Tax=Kosmotoga arenicorallina S304 TaxID=1453497 RepID=A0A182C7F8_9BACT|nr:class I mannose-6-phosphate isomerase [Kosmotoga arenicorallina]OAA31543.1 hypothetical protein AT15_05570 [Kosmotoga arenicorallina S304]
MAKRTNSNTDQYPERLEAVNITGHNFGKEGVFIGEEEIEEILFKEINRFSCDEKNVALALDGYVFSDWESFLKIFRRCSDSLGMKFELFNADLLRKDKGELSDIYNKHLGTDPVFGKVYRKGLRYFFDEEELFKFKKKLAKRKKGKDKALLVVYGSGSALSPLRKLYDIIIFADLTREEVLRRYKSQGARFGTQSIGPKSFYYIDFPACDAHRNYLIRYADYYLDANDKNYPVMLNKKLLEGIVKDIASRPFRLKPIYEPGPWGGQWLKKVRNLPEHWVNCAWSYEVIAPEMSLYISTGETVLELPWNLFFNIAYREIMGDVPKHRFGGEFPIRFDYLDTMNGGDLSIQVHPTTTYIRRNFNEHYHQGEMYYIVDCKPNRRVNLGLLEETSLEEFRKAAERAENEGIPFDYEKFVNSVPAKKHDLFMIPPGTVHGSREGLVVLEISATTYRYTFKIYDHLRPDLSGVMRPIHIDHAFKVIKSFRRTKWVSRNLKQKPLTLRVGKEFREELIADRPEFFHEVHRVTFKGSFTDDTKGRFHVITVVEGSSIELVSGENKKMSLGYSETAIIPASTGKYMVKALDNKQCKVVKAFLKG